MAKYKRKKKSKSKAKTKKGMHKMPNGRMMSDAEMDRMMKRRK